MKNNGNSFAAAMIFLALAMLAQRAFSVDLISNLTRCAPGMTPYFVLNGQERTSGKFYGYVNAGNGPGDSAFVDAKAWADEHNTPLVVVYDSGGGNSNTFIADLNDDEDYQGGRYLLQWMNNKAGPDNFNCMFTYFKGPPTAPPACKDAYEFCKGYGASSYPCVVCYWKWPDGTIKTSATSGLSSVGSFKGPVDSFIARNKPPPTPPYVPPKSNAAFAVKDSEMEATVDTAQVYVPIIRTNGTDRAETEYLVTDYPDGTVKTNDLAWAVGGAYIESLVNLAGRLSKVGDKVSLYILNTNKIAVATNSITCVAKPANAATYPSGIGAGGLEWGEWTIDYAAATSKVFEANAYLQPDTNELGSVAFETPLDWSTSNRYDTVYTNDITAFASDRVAFEREFSYSVSNVNTVVVTNDLQLFAKLGEFEDLDHVAASEIVVTNTTTTKYVSDMIDRQTTTNTQ
ncbi:MAG: hypothetical protein IKO87_04190, partial [Kiritimatiellae bacterium]|nr:hypothetical protein [Kiritimatiellia bacterium]